MPCSKGLSGSGISSHVANLFTPKRHKRLVSYVPLGRSFYLTPPLDMCSGVLGRAVGLCGNGRGYGVWEEDMSGMCTMYKLQFCGITDMSYCIQSLKEVVALVAPWHRIRMKQSVIHRAVGRMTRLVQKVQISHRAYRLSRSNTKRLTIRRTQFLGPDYNR